MSQKIATKVKSLNCILIRKRPSAISDYTRDRKYLTQQKKTHLTFTFSKMFNHPMELLTKKMQHNHHQRVHKITENLEFFISSQQVHHNRDFHEYWHLSTDEYGNFDISSGNSMIFLLREFGKKYQELEIFTVLSNYTH